MRLGAVVTTAVAALALAMGFYGGATPPASADGGPHTQNQPMTTDACAGCHRAHTAQASYLLKTTETQLCMTCHDGSGATTDVQDGVLLAAPGGAVTGALRGGGFENAMIDTEDPSDDSAPQIGVLLAPEPVTSFHSHDGTPQTMWGNGAISGAPNAGLANYPLECSSCHNPHGNGLFRILRPVPLGSGAVADVSIPDVSPKNYSTSDYFASGLNNGSAWCAQCHTRYRSDVANSANINSGDGIFKYRHRTNGVGISSCVRCHAAHGTNAAATGIAATVSRPGQGTNGVGGADAGSSSLLKMDNRGICQKCHTR